MITSHSRLITRAAVVAAMLICANAVFSQEEESESTDAAADEAIEEVVVYAHRPGDEVDLDARYEELLRTRAAAELDRLEVLNEEYEWRKSLSEDEDSSRIKWGYNPEVDMSTRRDTTLTDLPTDTVKPATLFRVEF